MKGRLPHFVELDRLVATMVEVSPQLHLWDLWETLYVTKKGQLLLCKDNLGAIGVWVVANVYLTDDYRRDKSETRPMRELILELLPHYDAFISDFSGGTSEDAIHMWERVGATRFPTERCPKGYVYFLCSKNLPSLLKTPVKSAKARAAAAT